MNRLSKFRGKCTKSGDWVYGDLIHGVGHKSGNIYILPRVINLAGVKHCDPLDGVKVIPETVGQFTSLFDKNGVEVFEGDIICHNDKRFVCAWSKVCGYCFVEMNKNLGSFANDGIVMMNHNRRTQSEIVTYIKYCEIAGNIHEQKPTEQ